MKYRNWQIPYTAPQPPEALLRAGYSPLLAVLLALRGYADPMQARAFLSGGDQSAFDPMLLQDMDKAVARIRTAIERRENVAVFGDYDVDGITSTCVLTDYLRRQGVPVHPYIPDRIEEGYGLNMDAITNLQRTSDITLIITVDCGITAIDETNYALQRGIDMVITDHHECSGQAIPNAVAFLFVHKVFRNIFKLSYSCFYTYLYTKQKPIHRVSTKCIGFYYALDKICIP